jgi:hypothetical protein
MAIAPPGAEPDRGCVDVAPVNCPERDCMAIAPPGAPRSAGAVGPPVCADAPGVPPGAEAPIAPSGAEAPSGAVDEPEGGAALADAGVSSPTTCVSDICGFFFDSADTHQIAPATANTASTNNAGATNLLESVPAGALTMRVRSGAATLLCWAYS